MRDCCGEDGLELLHIPTRQSQQHHLIDMLFHICLQALLQEYLITAAVLTACINDHLLKWPAIAASSTDDLLMADWLEPVTMGGSHQRLEHLWNAGGEAKQH